MNNFNPYQNPNNGYNNQFIQQYYIEQQKIQYYKNKRGEEIRSLIGTGVLLGLAILAMLVIETVLVMKLQQSSYYSTYESSPVFQHCFNILAVHMSSLLIPFSVLALIKKKSLTGPLIPLKKIGALKTAAWTAFGIGVSLAANIVVNWIIVFVEKLGYKLTQPETLKVDSVLACITLIVSTAVVPAVFEEFAFRCCALGVLKKYGKAFGVVAVSVVFGLIHGNVIQFIFAFLIGLVFGYVTIKTDSVLPAMLIHGINNGLSVAQEILTWACGKKLNDSIITVVIVIMIVLAIAGLIYLAYTKQLAPAQRKQPREPYALSFGGKLLCLVPGLFVPFVILIWMTSQYVTKI